MKRAYNIFWAVLLILIPFLPLSGILYGVDPADVGLSINQYYFCFEDIDSVYLPILLTELMGGAWLKVCGFLSIPPYLGVELAWALACLYMALLSWLIFRRYMRDELLLPALCLALMLAKCNFHYFIYATGVAVMALTALFFLILALNEERPILLAPSVFFLVMACLCKVSSIAQFAVYAVLFYDLWRRRDRAVFIRQIACCALGLAAGLAAAALIIGSTCGFSAYGDMMVEMFLYAGNSQDGHSLGSMVMSNVKGLLRGALLLLIPFLAWLVTEKAPRLRGAASWAVPIAALLLVVGKVIGLDNLPVISGVYGVLSSYLNALAVIVALIYVCAILILRDGSYTAEFQNIALCSGVLTVLMPLGSNTGIQHICNECFFVIPYIVIYLGDRIREARRRDGRRLATQAVSTSLIAVVGVWCVGLVGWQSLYLARAAWETDDEIKACTMPQLRGMYYEADLVDDLEGTARFLRQFAGRDEETGELKKLLVAGPAPLLNFLSDMPPFNAGSGGWIDTEFITYEKVKMQLEEADELPVVVLVKKSLSEDIPKVELVASFVEDNPYEEAYETERYLVYVPEGRMKAAGLADFSK